VVRFLGVSIVSVVPQKLKLFNSTVAENISFGEVDSPGHSEKKHEETLMNVESFCEKMGFYDFFEKFPNGIKTIVGEEGVNLSLGQQQLIVLARALYRRPQLLLLDEPTSAMDKKTEGFVLTLLDKLKQELGILIVTHRIDMVNKMDRAYILEEGLITAQGSHRELLTTNNLYKRELIKLKESLIIE